MPVGGVVTARRFTKFLMARKKWERSCGGRLEFGEVLTVEFAMTIPELPGIAR